MHYPRNMLGYGATPPSANWPDKSAVAVQFVVNYEEGAENCILHGDEGSEAFLSEIVGAASWPGQRHWNMESIYEYGARAGFWRLHRLFTEKQIPVTVYGVAEALQRSPQQVQAMLDADWEIASHGLKWIEYKDFPREKEKAYLDKTIRLHEAVTGQRPTGWYLGRCSVNTVDLVSEEGGFDYISDTYDDDLPYWRRHEERDQLIIPYTLDCNDMRFATPQGFNSGDQFEAYLRDTFDTLYAEGKAGQPKMMSIGLHCRLIGRPGRLAALKRFIEHASSHENVWFARRIDIANHWKTHHPAPINSPTNSLAHRTLPSQMSRAKFISAYGNVFKGASWVAAKAYDAGLGAANDTAAGLHHALKIQFRLGDESDRQAGVAIQIDQQLEGEALEQLKAMLP